MANSSDHPSFGARERGEALPPAPGLLWHRTTDRNEYGPLMNFSYIYIDPKRKQNLINEEPVQISCHTFYLINAGDY